MFSVRYNPCKDAHSRYRLPMCRVTVDPVLTIAACLSSKLILLNPMDKRDEATDMLSFFRPIC
ncbi:hypothetical protein BJV78DRAFT_1389142 [Lactifluus subvellereus]|nr:hypothetical protein BJV78DRAFT_1389142 [Lactifluus subvellereus]